MSYKLGQKVGDKVVGAITKRNAKIPGAPIFTLPITEPHIDKKCQGYIHKVLYGYRDYEHYDDGMLSSKERDEDYYKSVCKGIFYAREGKYFNKRFKRLKNIYGDRNVIVIPSGNDFKKAEQAARLARKKYPEKVVIITHEFKGADWGKIAGVISVPLGFGIYAYMSQGAAAVSSTSAAATAKGGATAAATAGGQVSTTAGAATKAAVTSGTKAAATGTVSKAATTAGTAAGLSKVVRPKPIKPRVVSELEKAQQTADAISSLYATVSNAPYTRRPDSNRQNYTAQAGSGSRIYRERGRDAGERGGISWVMLGGAAALVAALMM